MRPEMDELAAFALVVDTGSFTKAAERLGLSKSIVSRRIAGLEDRIGVRLLTRSTHFVTPTALGIAFHERARRILNEVDEAVGFLSGSVSEVTGAVRMTSPTTFGTMYLMPAIHDMLVRYPRLDVNVELRDTPVDLVAEGFDLAIRIGRLKDSALIARQIKPVRQALVCSPAYAERRGIPQAPRELVKHECIFLGNDGTIPQWKFMVAGGWETIRTSGRLKANNPELVREAALSGLGIAALPLFVASAALQRGALIQVLKDYPMGDLGLFTMFPANPHLPMRVRTIVDFLAGRWTKPLPNGAPHGAD